MGASASTTSSSFTASSASSLSGRSSRHTTRTWSATRSAGAISRYAITFGRTVSDTNLYPERTARRAILERVHHLPAQAEDLLGVPESHAPCFGEQQPSTRANEKLLAQRIFQVADLCADGWGSQQQLLRSIGDAPAPGYLP